MKSLCIYLTNIFFYRCEALNFQMSKSQKKIMKRMIRFLKNELPKDEEKTSRNKHYEDIGKNHTRLKTKHR